MIISSRRRRRSIRIVLAGSAALALVSACAGGSGNGAAAPSSSAAAPSSQSAQPTESDQTSTNDELAAALLPAEAFGPDTNVVTVDVRQLSTPANGGLPTGGSITPTECGKSVGATQLTPEDFGAIVAQTATGPDSVTVQVLAESEQNEGEMPQFDKLLDQCPKVTVKAPDGSTATIKFADLDVPDLGDTSDGIRMTTAVSAPDGTNLTVPSLLAVAVDGPRILFLQQAGTNSAPLDEAAFTALFEQAFQTQHDN